MEIISRLKEKRCNRQGEHIWGSGFHNRRSAWPSRQKREYRNARTFFFHLNKKFGKMIKKTCQYMLNVVPHIFSFINFCVRFLVFFYNWRKPYFLKVRNQSIFYNQLSVFRTNFSGIVWNFIKRLKKPSNFRWLFQNNKILNLLIIFIITVVAVKILMFQHTLRKNIWSNKKKWFVWTTFFDLKKWFV